MARVLAVVPDLMFASRVEATLRAVGHEVELVRAVDAIDATGADVVLGDLAEVDPHDLAALGPPVLGFYSHVDVDTRKRAEEAAIDLVVPRSRMAREMPELVASLLTGDRDCD